MKNFTKAQADVLNICTNMQCKALADFRIMPMEVSFRNLDDEEARFSMDEDGVIQIVTEWALAEPDLNKLKKAAQDFMTAYLLEHYVYEKVKKAPLEQTFTFME